VVEQGVDSFGETNHVATVSNKMIGRNALASHGKDSAGSGRGEWEHRVHEDPVAQRTPEFIEDSIHRWAMIREIGGQYPRIYVMVDFQTGL
jgi:hypothetical protein